MVQHQKPVPLLFIVQDSQSFTPSHSSAEAKAISSHVNKHYRGWKRKHPKNLIPDPTTKAILTSSLPYDIPADDDALQATHRGSDSFLSEYRDQLMQSSSQWVYGSFKLRSLPARKELLVLHDNLHIQFSRLGTQTLDPFAPDFFKRDRDLQANLFFYSKIIRPFAVHLLKDWPWIDNLSQVQSSPVLAYAVAAYASVFFSGSLRGGPGVVLPPPVEKGQQPLWQIPSWLRLQTCCLAELNATLSEPSRIDESCYQAILMLFRLSVLLSDGESGRMHFKALRRISAMIGRKSVDLEKEMAVNKINVISAFLHNSSVVIVRTRPHKISGRIKEVVKLHRKLWTSDREWYSFCAAISGRTLTWRAERPSGHLLANTASAIARMDWATRTLPENDVLELQRCYQIALYLSVYLNNISFNTSAPNIRSNALELQARLSLLHLPTITSFAHCTVFNLLMVGAMATRACPERTWFVRLIATHYVDVVRIDQVYRLLADYIDPLHVVYNAVEDTWDDVTNFRSIRLIGWEGGTMLDNDDFYEIKNLRPMNYSPDLFKPIDLVEVEDPDFDLKVGFT